MEKSVGRPWIGFGSRLDDVSFPDAYVEWKTIVRIFLLPTARRGDSMYWFLFYRNDSYYLLHNARIHTVDASIPFADSVVIKKGRFLDVGKADDLKRKHPDAKKVDLRGRMVVPGLIDAHGVRKQTNF